MDYLLIGIISPWLIMGLFFIIILLLLLQLPTLLRALMKVPKPVILLLFVTLAVGAYVRFAWTPNMDRIYFDEDRYLSYAVSFARFNQETSLEAATPKTLILGKIDQVARITVPTLNGLVLKMFGMSKTNLHLTAKLFSTLQILLLFTAVVLLFENPVVAAIASFIFALTPVNIFWAPSTALDSYFVFFSLLAFVGACWYGRNVTFKSSLFFATTTTLLLFVRFEAFLFLFVLLGVIFAVRKTSGKKLLEKNDLRFLTLIAPLILFRALISISVLGQTWCCGEATPLEAFQTGYFIRNTLPNIASLFNRPEFPFIIAILALFTLLGRRDLRILPLALWLFFYFFIYSFYFAGLFYTYSFSGSYGRYFLMLVPSFTILSSLSLYAVWELFKKSHAPLKILLVALCFCALATLYPTVQRYRGMIYLSSYDYIVDMPARRLQDFLRLVILPQTPKDSIIIHPLTDLILLDGRTGIYFGTFLTNKDIIKYVRREILKRPVFMIETHTCVVNPEKCEKILPYFELVDYPLKEATPSGLALLQLRLKKALK